MTLTIKEGFAPCPRTKHSPAKTQAFQPQYQKILKRQEKFATQIKNNLHNPYHCVIIPLVVAEWSSLVARRAHNPKVVGSNPASARTKKPRKH